MASNQVVSRLKGVKGRKMQPAVEFARNNGYQVILSGGGHLQFMKNGRRVVSSSHSPRTDRPARHVISVIRREIGRETA